MKKKQLKKLKKLLKIYFREEVKQTAKSERLKLYHELVKMMVITSPPPDFFNEEESKIKKEHGQEAAEKALMERHKKQVNERLKDLDDINVEYRMQKTDPEDRGRVPPL